MMTGLDEVRLVARVAAQRMHATPRETAVLPHHRYGTTPPLPCYTYSGSCPPVHDINARVTGPRGRSYRRLLGLTLVLHQLLAGYLGAMWARTSNWTNRSRRIPSQTMRDDVSVAGLPTPYESL